VLPRLAGFRVSFPDVICYSCLDARLGCRSGKACALRYSLASLQVGLCDVHHVNGLALFLHMLVCFVRGGRYGADGFAWKALRVTLHTKLHWEILDAGVTFQAKWTERVFMCVMVYA